MYALATRRRWCDATSQSGSMPTLRLSSQRVGHRRISKPAECSCTHYLLPRPIRGGLSFHQQQTANIGIPKQRPFFCPSALGTYAASSLSVLVIGSTYFSPPLNRLAVNAEPTPVPLKCGVLAYAIQPVACKLFISVSITRYRSCLYRARPHGGTEFGQMTSVFRFIASAGPPTTGGRLPYVTRPTTPPSSYFFVPRTF